MDPVNPITAQPPSIAPVTASPSARRIDPDRRRRGDGDADERERGGRREPDTGDPGPACPVDEYDHGPGE